MAAVPVTIVGIETRDDGTSGQVTIIGMASITGFRPGGGPSRPPPMVSGGPIDPYPDIGGPGPQPGGPTHIWGGGGVGDYIDAGFPGPQPIVPVPPGPNVPPPGSPPQMISGSQPVNPITPPDAIIVEYPGVGKVIVPKPTETITPPQGGQQQGQGKPPQPPPPPKG